MRYRGRFAPSPTGPLHAGSLVAALASWLDARAHGGIWLVRIEDVDVPRCIAGMGGHILSQLAAFGLASDEAPLVQSQRAHTYQQALETLIANGQAYPCRCSRKDVLTALQALRRERSRHAELFSRSSLWRQRPASISPVATMTEVRLASSAWFSISSGLKGSSIQ